MKKLITLLFLVAFSSAYAQAPHGFNYQAVARDAGGVALTNQAIGMQISLLQGSSTGSAVYTETHTVTSNNLGLLNLVVGNGTPQSGSFMAIDWANGPYYIEISMDVTGGTSYVLMGTQQLLSVPYALYAASSGTAGAQGATGVTGATGVNGATGATGNDGANGIDGATGATGVQGVAGIDGATGATGLAGADGTDGAQGAQGAQGADGVTGATGSTGATGVAGTNGTNGATGNTGATGVAGTNGVTGATGTNGTNGATGSTGATGVAGTNGTNGITGATGATGTAGTNGTNGATGSTGATGTAGTNGTNGATGATGSAGTDGATGNTGATGIAGTNGTNGTTGATGTAGTNGTNGVTGSTGATGTAGTNGTDGATGSTGATGVAGTNGTNGATGATGASSPNNSFTYIANGTTDFSTSSLVYIDVPEMTLTLTPVNSRTVISFQIKGASTNTFSFRLLRNGVSIMNFGAGSSGGGTEVSSFPRIVDNVTPGTAYTYKVQCIGTSGTLDNSVAMNSTFFYRNLIIQDTPLAGASGSVGPTGATGTAGTNGTDGATGSTGATGDANISGTTNYVMKFTGATTGGNSLIFDNGTSIGIGTVSPVDKFHVVGGGARIENASPSLTLDHTGFSQMSRLYFRDTYGSGRGDIFWSQTNGLSFTANGYGEVMRMTSTGNVGIGTTTPNSTLTTIGSQSVTINTTALATITLTNTDYVLVKTGAGSTVVNLPQASTCSGRVYKIAKAASTGNLTIDAFGSELVDGAITLVLNSAVSVGVEIISNGTQWYVISQF